MAITSVWNGSYYELFFAQAAAQDERIAQLADLRSAVEASTQPPAIPANYIDGHITGPDRELLEAFYTACNSEGGTADEIHLRGIHAAIAHAATGVTVPTPVEDGQSPEPLGNGDGL